jgi:predicted lipase
VYFRRNINDRIVSTTRSAKDVLEAVETTIQHYGVKKVTVVGHSLGAALALLDSISLQLRIPGLSVQMMGYGMPRVGNREFASYVEGCFDVPCDQ